MNSIARYFKCMMPRSSRRCILCPDLPDDIWYKILSEISLSTYPQISIVNSIKLCRVQFFIKHNLRL